MSKYNNLTKGIALALKMKAVGKLFKQGHMMLPWQHAKKAHGVAAERSLCKLCGLHVIIMPRCEYERGKVSPGMKGDALFQECVALDMVH